MNGFGASLAAWGYAGEPPAVQPAAASINASTRGGRRDVFERVLEVL